MRFECIDPFVRQAIIGEVNQNTKYDVFNRLKTRDCRLFYIVSGFGNMIVENVTYPIKPKTTILFQAGTEYIWDTSDVRFYSVNFDYTKDFSYIKETFHPIHSEIFGEQDVFQVLTFEDVSELDNAIVLESGHSLESRLHLLTTEYYMGGQHCDLLLSSILKSVIVSIVRQNSEKKTLRECSEATLARKIVEYISANYNKNLSNSTIAEEFHFNPSYINRVFKKHIGIAMHEFLLNYRFNMAMELLHTQNTPIKEIAKMTGFENPQHFNKAFKKRTGQPPNKYRKIDLQKI